LSFDNHGYSQLAGSRVDTRYGLATLYMANSSRDIIVSFDNYLKLAGTTRLRPASVLVNKSFLTAPESMQSHSKNDKNAYRNGTASRIITEC